MTSIKSTDIFVFLIINSTKRVELHGKSRDRAFTR